MNMNVFPTGLKWHAINFVWSESRRKSEDLHFLSSHLDHIKKKKKSSQLDFFNLFFPQLDY